MYMSGEYETEAVNKNMVGVPKRKKADKDG